MNHQKYLFSKHRLTELFNSFCIHQSYPHSMYVCAFFSVRLPIIKNEQISKINIFIKNIFKKTQTLVCSCPYLKMYSILQQITISFLTFYENRKKYKRRRIFKITKYVTKYYTNQMNWL